MKLTNYVEENFKRKHGRLPNATEYYRMFVRPLIASAKIRVLHLAWLIHHDQNRSAILQLGAPDNDRAAFATLL